jgi:hypothetical protein
MTNATTVRRRTDAAAKRPTKPLERLPWHAHGLRLLLDVARSTDPTSRQIKHLEQRLSIDAWKAGFYAVPLSDMPHEEIERLFELVVKAVEQLLTVGHWSAPVPLNGVHLLIVRQRDGGAMQRSYRNDQEDWEPVFWLTFSELLQAAGHRLRQCEVCRGIFVRTGRRDYCSSRCGQRLRSRRFYQSHREDIQEQRAARYARSKLPAKSARRPQSSRLQRIATEVGTGRAKTPQVKVARRKNARQSPRGKSGR